MASPRLSGFSNLLPEELASRHVLVAEVSKVHLRLKYLKFSPGEFHLIERFWTDLRNIKSIDHLIGDIKGADEGASGAVPQGRRI